MSKGKLGIDTDLNGEIKIESIVKRDETVVKFEKDRLLEALTKASQAMTEPLGESEVYSLTEEILKNCPKRKFISVEDLEEVIVRVASKKHIKLVNSYMRYNKMREKARMMNTGVFKSIGKIAKETDRDNANVGNNFSSKLLRIASESNKYANLATMEKSAARKHEIGDLYYHDLDSYNLTVNCLHIPAGEVLSRTFNTGYGTLNTPNRITSAADLMCILIQSSQNDMYGGQSIPDFDTDLAPYLRKTLKEHCLTYSKEEDMRINGIGEPNISRMTEMNNRADKFYKSIRKDKYIARDVDSYNIINRTLTDLNQAMSGVVHNLNTMHSRAGSQVPFSSLNIGLPHDIEGSLICESFLKNYDKGLGKGEQPIFPNIAFRVKSGVNKYPTDQYYHLFQLACKVAAKRMNPTFMNMDSSFNLPWYEKGIIPATMGCRTYVMTNINGPAGVNGRGNGSSTSMNLPRLAIKQLRLKGESSVGSLELIEDFFKDLDGLLNDAKDSLLVRYELLKGLKVKDIPFSAGQGLLLGSEGLEMSDSIKPILDNSTWAIGFIGIAETLMLLRGTHHGEDEESRKLALRIVNHIRHTTDMYTRKYKLNFSCYATPAEGLSGVFIEQDRKLYGNIPGITDKGYYTNSYHVPVDFKISINDKIQIEAPFHSLCNGGHISYIELDGTPTGKTVEKLIVNAYDTSDISYIGINFHIRYCKECNHYLKSEASLNCPTCGSSDIQGISRLTGYLGLDERFGYGKSNERKARTSHGDIHGNSTESSMGNNTYASINSK